MLSPSLGRASRRLPLVVRVTSPFSDTTEPTRKSPEFCLTLISLLAFIFKLADKLLLPVGVCPTCTTRALSRLPTEPFLLVRLILFPVTTDPSPWNKLPSDSILTTLVLAVPICHRVTLPSVPKAASNFKFISSVLFSGTPAPLNKEVFRAVTLVLSPTVMLPALIFPAADNLILSP